MSLETRLARCIAYRDEAMKRPKANALYIEDLNLSIDMFSKAIERWPSSGDRTVLIQKGWDDD